MYTHIHIICPNQSSSSSIIICARLFTCGCITRSLIAAALASRFCFFASSLTALLFAPALLLLAPKDPDTLLAAAALKELLLAAAACIPDSGLLLLELTVLLPFMLPPATRLCCDGRGAVAAGSVGVAGASSCGSVGATAVSSTCSRRRPLIHMPTIGCSCGVLEGRCEYISICVRAYVYVYVYSMCVYISLPRAVCIEVRSNDMMGF